jgi:fermentation-respiration switch protein FrsA (DUF1100 family)
VPEAVAVSWICEFCERPLDSAKALLEARVLLREPFSRYNRSLTPFGFQTERRSYWEATDLYTKISPFAHANKIKKPLLLIHGEADDKLGHLPYPVGAPFRGHPR